MTKSDVKNYLEKIYEVPVGAVRTRIQFGECLRCSTLTFSLGHICTHSHTHLLLSKHFILRSEFVKTYKKSKHQDICRVFFCYFKYSVTGKRTSVQYAAFP